MNQNMKRSLLKLYSSDVGLLTCQYGNAIRMKVLLGDDSVNLGGVYENAVAQELNTHGFPLYFYNDYRIARTIDVSIVHAAKRLVLQQMIL